MELFELADRWLHFGAGVLWIGLLYFFNWVNSAFAPTMDAETKKKVIPELMPRCLFWFRWGAMYTWITGVLLLFVVYYHGYEGANLFEGQHPKPTPGDWGPAFAGLFVGFAIYDTLFKAMAKQHSVAVVLWGAISVGFGWYVSSNLGFSDRATYIHVAGLFGTCMFANVWMRIWPAQQRIIMAIKNGEAPDGADAAMAGSRSKHNTYMSAALLLFMVGVGQPAMFSYEVLPTIAAVLVLSFVIIKALYAKAAKVPGF
ncbi:MAG: urate hydroxylase PuuD [Planctomycetota bacterium]|nr:urate hydroxylase PuuD [Planctomycetota bacterium]